MKQQDEFERHTNLAAAADTMLYDRYAPIIFAYARLHTSSREDAEDLTLEVFTAALENDNLSGLPEGEHLAWLRRVAHNKLVDGYRRSARRRVIALDQVAETLLDDEALTPEQVALQREMCRQLHQAIRSLPRLQQHVLQLRYGDGLPCAQIALLVNKREDAVRQLLSRTLKRLRSAYDHQ